MAELVDHRVPTAATATGSPSASAPDDVPPSSAEIRMLAGVQRRVGGSAVGVARGLSFFGEHAGGWLALGALGAAVDRSRRREWLAAAAGVALAHGASIGVKRVVRRTRPAHPSVEVRVGTPSRLSFPSAHATSTTAAALLYGRLLRRPLVPVLVPPMAPSDPRLGRPTTASRPFRRRVGRSGGASAVPNRRVGVPPRRVCRPTTASRPFSARLDAGRPSRCAPTGRGRRCGRCGSALVTVEDGDGLVVKGRTVLRYGRGDRVGIARSANWRADSA